MPVPTKSARTRLKSDSNNVLNRVKYRAPSYFHLANLKQGYVIEIAIPQRMLERTF